jgi:hypothetical protein
MLLSGLVVTPHTHPYLLGVVTGSASLSAAPADLSAVLCLGQYTTLPLPLQPWTRASPAFTGFSSYLPYANGQGYMLSQRVVQLLVHMQQVRKGTRCQLGGVFSWFWVPLVPLCACSS